MAAVARKGGKRIGYIRVSADDQNTERQLDGMELDRTFTDKLSGKDTDRPALKAALDYLRDGDVLVVHSFDRLARNLMDLLSTVKDLNSRGIVVEFHKENLIFTGDDSPMSMLLMSVMGAVSAFERAMIRERQREGISIAKRNGVYKGRKHALNAEQAATLRQRAAAGEQKAALAREYGVSRKTLYDYLAATTA